MRTLGLPGTTIGWWEYERCVGDGTWSESKVNASTRLTAIELLLDTVDDGKAADDFRKFVNERARWFHVGIRLDSHRFVPTTSEELHVGIIQPTLGLLSDSRFAGVDGLYRKGFDRALAGDASGAITAATSAVEATLRVLLPDMQGQSLGPLSEKARKDDLITPAIEDFLKKLYGLREESDAHAPGTSEFDLAMLALHLSGSLILYLGRASEEDIPV